MRIARPVSDDARRRALALTDYRCAACSHVANYVTDGKPYCGCCHATPPHGTGGAANE